jgi:hypothetical protein
LIVLSPRKNPFVKELPDDLGAMAESEPAERRAIRDVKLGPLFRGWPPLSRFGLVRRRRLYAERLKIARYLGAPSGAWLETRRWR